MGWRRKKSLLSLRRRYSSDKSVESSIFTEWREWAWCDSQVSVLYVGLDYYVALSVLPLSLWHNHNTDPLASSTFLSGFFSSFWLWSTLKFTWVRSLLFILSDIWAFNNENLTIWVAKLKPPENHRNCGPCSFMWVWCNDVARDAAICVFLSLWDKN